MSPTSSRPPSSSAQIAASNQTLNAFLGGGAKSWMQNAQPAPNSIPPPRPVIRSGIRPGRPAKNSSSAHKPSDNQPDAHTNMLINEEPVLPSPALTNEPSPGSSTRQASPNAITPGAQQPIYSNASLEPTAPSAGFATRTPAVPSRPNLDQQYAASVAATTYQENTEQAHRSPTNRGSKRGRKTLNAQNAKRVRSGQSQTGIWNLSSTQVDSLMESYVDIVKERIAENGGYQGLNQGVELPRYKYIKDACSAHDGFYLILHQLFCLWSLDRVSVLTALRPCEPNIIDRGFHILHQVLRSNYDMRREHLEWFAAFPPLEGGALGPLFRAHCSSVRFFLEALTARWGEILNTATQRRYPVTAYDLMTRMGCFSGILRMCFFTVSRRTLGVGDQLSLAGELSALFAEDQAIELGAAEYPSRFPDDSRRQIDMGRRYLNLINTAQQAALVPGSASGHSPPAATAQSPTNASTLTATNGQYAASIGTATTGQAPPPSQTSQALPVSHLPHTSPQPQSSLPHSAAHQSADQTHFVLPTQGGSGPQPSNQSRQWHQTATQGSGPSPVSASGANAYGSNFNGQSVQLSPYQPHQFQTQGLAQPQFFAPAHQQNYSGNWPAGPQQATSLQYPGPHHYQHSQTAPYQVIDQARLHQHDPRSQASPPQGFTAVQMAGPSPSSVDQAAGQVIPTQRQLQPPMVAPAQQLQSQRRQRPSSRNVNLIQEHQFPTGPYDWGSHEIAAHLPQLRSPKRRPKQGLSGKFYQYVETLAVPPTRVDPAYGIRTLEFFVPAEQFNAISPRGEVDEGDMPVRYYGEGSYRFRLRCCLRPTTQDTISESDWAVLDTTWPTETYIFFNNQPLCLPRKQHFHRDLPAELSDVIRQGANVVRFSLPGHRCNIKKDMTFFFAIEVVKTTSYARLKTKIKATEHMSPDITKEKIARRLRPDDSGDIIVEDEYLGISLADPFSSVIFEIPVRGINCQHLECFDLHNWLSTRRSKPVAGKSSEPSAVDCWKCPICGLDARPQNLRIDEYFVGIRKILLSQGKSRVKRIQASPDGSWVPEEEADDSDDEVVPLNDNGEERPGATPVRPGPANIIEILDD